MDLSWFRDRRIMHGHLNVRPGSLRPKAEGNRSTGARRLVQGLDDLHIDDAFQPVWLGITLPPDAGREVHELRSELISGFEALHLMLPIDHHRGRQASDIFVGRIDAHAPFRADNLVHRVIRCSEAAGKGRQSIMRKPHNDGRRFFHALKSAVAAAHEGRHFDGFVPKQIPCGVDAVDADVIQRASAQLTFQSDVAGTYLLRKDGVEETQLSQLSGLGQLNRPEIACFEVKPVRDHERDSMALGGAGHGAAIRGSHR